MSWKDNAQVIQPDRAPKAASWKDSAEKVAPAAGDEVQPDNDAVDFITHLGRHLMDSPYVRTPLRYGSGIVDTGIADVIHHVKTASKDDWTGQTLPNNAISDAFHGKPHDPTTLATKDLGLPPGASVADIPYANNVGIEKGGALDFNVRDTLANIASLGLDPLNSLAKVVHPVASLADAAGEKAYTNSLRKISAEPLKYKTAESIGENAFPKLAYREKIFSSGATPGKMLSELKDYLTNRVGSAYNAIIDHPAVAQQKAPVMQTLDETIPALQEAVGDSSFGYQGARKFSNRLAQEQGLDNLKYGGERNPRELLRRAKDYSDAARGKIGMQGDIMKEGGAESKIKDLMMTFAQDQRAKAAELAEKALPGAADTIRDLNTKYSIAKPAKSVLANMAAVDTRKFPVTQVDGMLAGHGAGAPDTHTMLRLLDTLTGKHLVRYINSPPGGVRIGNALRTVGESPILDNLLRRSLGTTSQGDQ